jgi:hypothetical protein
MSIIFVPSSISDKGMGATSRMLIKERLKHLRSIRDEYKAYTLDELPQHQAHSQSLVEIVERIDDLTILDTYQLLSYVAKRASYVSMDRVTVIVQTTRKDPIASITHELGELINSST